MDTAMDIVTVRRVGNSNVISLPRALEEQGYTPGTRVMLDTLPTGEIIVRLVDIVRTQIRAIGRELIAENRSALDILEARDRGVSSEEPIHHRPS